MNASLLNSAPFTIHDGDLSDGFGSSASPEEQPVASPGQYDDHDKRKFDQVDSNGKSPASKHSHTTPYQDSYDEDDDIDRPRKPGRKPMANTLAPTSVDPKQKRKAQNRAAQRAFRERKEKYVKELEDRIAELEATQKNSQDNASAVLEKENQQLKELVQKLEAENYLLKGTAFTFDFPISKANISKNTSALVPDAGVQPSTLLRNDGVVPSTTDAWTPPSSAHDDSGSEPSSPSGLTNSPNTNKTTDPSPASDSLNGVPGFSSNNSLTSFGDLSTGNLDSFFDNSAAFDTTAADRFMANHVPHKSSDEISNSSLFNQYRTPANAIENSTFSETPMPPLFENEFDDYNSFAPLLTPKEESLRETEFFDVDNIGKVHQAPDLKNPDAHLNPMQAWELLQQHPQFEELEIDDLCNEMKNKATCTEHTLTGEELQKVLEKKLYKN